MKGLAILLAATASVAAAAEPGHLHFVRTRAGAAAVQWVAGGRTSTVERFRVAQDIVASGTSRDGRLAYVWHHGVGAQRVSIYDLASASRIADFAPGFGGDLSFTPKDHLLHVWGCGLGCGSVRAYDARGRVLFERQGVDDLRVAPSRRFVMTRGPTALLRIYDVDSQRRVFTSATPLLAGAEQWDEAHGQVRFDVYASLDAPPRTLTVKLPP